MEAEEADVLFCTRSSGNKHHWKKCPALNDKVGNSKILGMLCVFCQVVKLKVLSLKAGVGGEVIPHMTVFPKGQLTYKTTTRQEKRMERLELNAVNGDKK